MLQFYIGEENRPKSIEFIYDVDASIITIPVTGTEFQRMVLDKIEQGSYYDDTRFKDRFGNLLNYTNMSSGSKALFLLEYCKDCVVNCTECGENALRMLSYLNDGMVFLNGRVRHFPWDIDYPVICNGRKWERVSLLNDFIR